MRSSADDLAFRRDGTLVAFENGNVGTVDRHGRIAEKQLVRSSEEVVPSAALSPDATIAAVFVQSRRSQVKAFRLSNGSVTWSATSGTSQYEQDRAYWSADASRLLVETDGPLRLRDARTGRSLRSFPHGTYYLGRQPLSPDGSTLAMATDDGVALLDAATGHRRTIDLGTSLDRPTWSNDGRSIAGRAAALTVVVDIRTGRVRRLRADAGDELAWSPDGRWLAAYATDRNDRDAGVSVIDVQTGRSTVIAKGGASEEQGRLTWSPDSRRVAYVSPPGISCATEPGGGIC